MVQTSLDTISTGCQLWSIHWYCHPINWVLTNFLLCEPCEYAEIVLPKVFCVALLFGHQTDKKTVRETFGRWTYLDSNDLPSWTRRVLWLFIPLLVWLCLSLVKGSLKLGSSRLKSHRSRQPGEVSFLLSMKIMPLVEKTLKCEQWQ